MFPPVFALTSLEYLAKDDWWKIVHPSLAVAFVFPIIGMVANLAWMTRQRRLQAKGGEKSKIPVSAGPEHLRIGKILTSAVVGLCLLGIARPSWHFIEKNQLWEKEPFQVIFIFLMFAFTIASLVILYLAQNRVWRITFGSLCSMGVLLLGYQDLLLRRDGYGAIFRRDPFVVSNGAISLSSGPSEWYLSHYNFGIAVTLLMILSLIVVPEIYRDRSLRFRILHAILNLFAIFLFIGQGLTGARDLLEVPLSWQEPVIYSCDFQNKTCGGQK